MSGSSAPRLKDVAQAANVSMSAASRILRGECDRFGEDTCERVLQAARQLGWRRNLLVNGMQTGRTKMIGVMIPPFDSFWVDVLAGIHLVLAAADYLPITVWVGDCQEIPHFEKGDEQGLEQISRLLDRRVDGLILWPSFAVAYYSHFRELIERRVPVVVIDHEFSEDQIADSIETDEQRSTKAVAEHLISLGHENIACFSSRETAWQAWAVRRRESFEKAVREHKGAKVNSWRLNQWGSNGVEVAEEILTQDPRPSAVFTVTDHEALFVYEAAANLGLRIPEDVSVVGFADLDFAAALQPPLTTMRQRPKEIGRRAAQLVLDRLDGDFADNPPTTIRVSAELIVRGSSTQHA
ncbi:LacI family DNA-binding transcriptional regulator [Bythopirellula polymerisocia]|uniref:HTH-type transcriptional repressor CytR n=1 Tax=Bythopirellula polymerisocia TaxID=2528003 RepID=A0A5C6D222_9BACT|nr:LacI family DNA-binding transcriptional regulator [Bythopirellula polymerisocia]TWU29256.1 HTH-type transcriptional repressor CytR [Bythopirellula polymerisocia]